MKPSSANAQDWVFAIADDLTGALEVGACFPGSIVSTNRLVSGTPGAPALVIDTETRHLPAGEAAAVVYETVLSALPFHPRLIYKKTDSTLRGNIAAEFGALLKAMPDREIVYAPAYPQMGRTVKEGRLLVHGLPVHQTAFALDTLNPVLTSNIRALMDGLPVTILDGESVADLEGAACSIIQRAGAPIAAGPAALAACLKSGCETVPLPRIARCLIVNGSMHPVSAEQINFAKECGSFDDEWIYFEAERIALRCADRLWWRYRVGDSSRARVTRFPFARGSRIRRASFAVRAPFLDHKGRRLRTTRLTLRYS